MRETMPYELQGISFLLEGGSWLPEELYELATLAQHNGVPTRLIDWTQEINIALYFAVSGLIHKKGNPERLTYNEWNDKSQELLEKALHYFKTKEFKKEKESRIEIWALDKRVALTHIGANPLRIIHPRYHNNENLGAQKGILTFWEIKKPIKKDKVKGNIPDFSWKDEKTLDEHITDFLSEKKEPSKPYLYHITLPETGIVELYKFIKHNGIDAAHLFPGYNGVVRCMQEENMFNKISKKQSS